MNYKSENKRMTRNFCGESLEQQKSFAEFCQSRDWPTHKVVPYLLNLVHLASEAMSKVGYFFFEKSDEIDGGNKLK